jgi:hypothetical protein
VKKNHPVIISSGFLIISLLLLFYLPGTVFAESSDYTSGIKNVLDEKEIYDRVCEIFRARNSAFINKDLKVLPQYFDKFQKFGTWALEHEVRRVKYLSDWSMSRGISFTNISSQVIIKKIYKTGNGIKIVLLESYRFDYKYDDDPPVINTFGVGINHTMNLVKRNGIYVIYNDWYTDCFEDGLKSYTGNISEIKFNDSLKLDIKKYSYNSELINTARYKRINAVNYADKYCGGAYGNGNNFK